MQTELRPEMFPIDGRMKRNQDQPLQFSPGAVSTRENKRKAILRSRGEWSERCGWTLLSKPRLGHICSFSAVSIHEAIGTTSLDCCSVVSSWHACSGFGSRADQVLPVCNNLFIRHGYSMWQLRNTPHDTGASRHHPCTSCSTLTCPLDVAQHREYCSAVVASVSCNETCESHG